MIDSLLERTGSCTWMNLVAVEDSSIDRVLLEQCFCGLDRSSIEKDRGLAFQTIVKRKASP